MAAALKPLQGNIGIGVAPCFGMHLPRKPGKILALLAACASVSTAVGLAPPAHAAGVYTLTASTSLTLDGATVVQRWTATCEGEPDDEARIIPSGKELRFFAAPDQVAAVGVDDLSYAVGAGEVGADYRYEGVVGARVFARFTVRCGTPDNFDEIVVESLPIVVAPALDPPTSVQRSDTLLPAVGGDIPVGVEVELVGLGVRGNPRGEELLVLTISGQGVDVAADLSSDDVGAEGVAFLSPHFTAFDVGDVIVQLSLLDTAAAPLSFNVVTNDDDDGPPPDPSDADGSAVGCGHSGAPTTATGMLLVLMPGRRRRPRAVC